MIFRANPDWTEAERLWAHRMRLDARPVEEGLGSSNWSLIETQWALKMRLPFAVEELGA